MAILKQNTAYTRLFLMVETSDHVTGITGASPVVKLSKNGASGVTATNSPATQVDATNLPGVYSIALTAADTNTVGDLAFNCTAASADPTTFVDQVQFQIFTDLQLSSGRALIANNLQQNAALNGFPFTMTSTATGQPQPGLIITATRTLGGGGFSPCANPVVEIADGWYYINLASSDLDNGTVGLNFTAAGANTLAIQLLPTP